MVNKTENEDCRMMLDATIDHRKSIGVNVAKAKANYHCKYTFMLFCITILVLSLAPETVNADEGSNNSKPKGPLSGGLFSHVNNWFSRLRGNRDNHNNNVNNDDKKEEKKEEPTVKPAMGMMYPPGIPMAPGYPPMGPYSAMMGAPPGPMYGPPMGMSSIPFGPPPPPRPMHPHHHHPHSHHGPPPMAMSFASPLSAHMHMSPMSNPFAFSGSHAMPVHHDYGGSDAYGAFSPYGNFPSSDPGEESFAGAHRNPGSEIDPASAHGDDYGYHKK